MKYADMKRTSCGQRAENDFSFPAPGVSISSSLDLHGMFLMPEHSLSPHTPMHKSHFCFLSGSAGLGLHYPTSPAGATILTLEYMIRDMKISCSPSLPIHYVKLYTPTSFLKWRNAFINNMTVFVSFLILGEDLLARFKSSPFQWLCVEVWISSFFHGHFQLPYF